jgi:hypothetical protein
VYGYAQEKKTLTIVMEYMELGDLFSILEVRLYIKLEFTFFLFIAVLL